MVREEAELREYSGKLIFSGSVKMHVILCRRQSADVLGGA